MTAKLVQKGKKKQTYQTPDDFLDLVRKVDPIMLDPCADPKRQFAVENVTEVDGYTFELDWAHYSKGGLAYANPPYKYMRPWIEKCILEAKDGIQLILLAASKTGTNWFRDAWNNANAVCFWNGRITFYGCKDPAYFDSVVFYWGKQPYKFCDVFEPHGIVQTL